MTSDPAHADHAGRFRPGIAETAAVLAAIAGLLCWLVWEAASPVA